MTTIKNRISKLEEQRSGFVEPERMATLTPQERYFAMLDQPVRHRKGSERPLEKRLGRSVTPDEAYAIMIGNLDPEKLCAKGGRHASHR